MKLVQGITGGYLIDKIEAYYIDVLGYSADDIAEWTTDELVNNLTDEQAAEFGAYSE